MFEFYDNEKNYLKTDVSKKKKEKPKITIIDVSEWKVSRFTQASVNSIKKATIYKKRGELTVVIIVDSKDLSLFTNNIFNRLQALLRDIYKSIVLLEIESPEDDEKRKRELLLIKAQRAHKKREKEYLKSLNSAKNCDSVTLN